MARWEDDPPTLMVDTVAAASLAVAAALVGVGRHAGYTVAAGLLALASALCGFRAWQLSRVRRLDEGQARQLRVRLADLPRTNVRVLAVNDPEAIAYARQLLGVLRKAGWPATGVYRYPHDDVGVFLAIKDKDDVPQEALGLLEALHMYGVPASQATKEDLADRRTVELLVGHWSTS